MDDAWSNYRQAEATGEILGNWNVYQRNPQDVMIEVEGKTMCVCVAANKAISGLPKPFEVHIIPLCNLVARHEITGFNISHD